MIKQEVQENEQKKQQQQQERTKNIWEEYQPLVVTPKVTSPELSVPVQYKLHKLEEGSDI